MSKSGADLTGKRFALYQVIRKGSSDRHSHRRWFCRCDCGTEHEVLQQSLLAGRATSCGCDRIGRPIERHGDGTKRELYAIWVGMKARCRNPANHNYSSYGARGITICERWFRSFIAFRDDMGPRPSRLHSIDRVDNNSGYEPGNCRWATASEQQRNRRDTYLVVLNEKAVSIFDAAEALKVHPAMLRERLESGWTDDEALFTPKFSSPNRLAKRAMKTAR